MGLYAQHLYENVPGSMNLAILIHIVCWLAQFVGHGAFEKRAPALLDNLVQALLLAPLFVFMEILFSLGYKPELRKKFEANVAEALKNINKNK